MTNQELDKLISELQNGDDQQRRAASYKLGKSKNPEAVPALIHAFDDTDSSVQQNAINGLKNIGSKDAIAFLNSKEINITNKNAVQKGWRIQENQRGRLIGVLALFSVAFLLSAQHPVYIVAFWIFPLGLVYWFEDWYDITNVSFPVLFLVLGWLLYYRLSSTIVFSNNRKVTWPLFLVLLLLLLLNIHGCRVQDQYYW